MVTIQEIDENNFTEAARLSLSEEQQSYLARPIGIIARGYVYRDLNPRVLAICDGGRVIGLALVHDFAEEPFYYDLEQFMIDREHQNRGHGTAALEQILGILRSERRFDGVEVCVNRSNSAALHVFHKAGFCTTDYIDEDLPNCLNLLYLFE